MLSETLGVALFGKQAMQVAIHCAGFTPGEANLVQGSMATFKVAGGADHFRHKLIEAIIEQDYERMFAGRTFSQHKTSALTAFPRPVPPASC